MTEERRFCRDDGEILRYEGQFIIHKDQDLEVDVYSCPHCGEVTFYKVLRKSVKLAQKKLQEAVAV